jgi:hypothetical protein
MRIENIAVELNESSAKLSAMISWEDCPRPPQLIYFETPRKFANRFTCNPSPFLIAACISGMHHGEKRVRVEYEVCPELLNGLATAMCLLRHWYGRSEDVPAIECKGKTKQLSQRVPGRAGFFLTGGVDSLTTLRLNRLHYPIEHPGSIKDGLIAFGLEVSSREAFEHVLSLLAPFAQQAEMEMIPISTNVRYLDDDWQFWSRQFQGAVLASIAHVFSGRLTRVSIGSTDDIAHLEPFGSHPLLDCNYSSHDLHILHQGIAFSRLEKCKILTEWDKAIRYLRVCNRGDYYQQGMVNCGKCEKCIRTMLALVALGKLEGAQAFPRIDVSENDIRNHVYLTSNTVYEYEEILPLLKQRDRHDLVRAIQRVIANYRGEVGFTGALKRFDRVRLNQGLCTLKRALFSPSDAGRGEGV